ncbi:four helix bundle protein [Sphingobacterium sp. SYP-B4668]|uniref:four helix bundle protein n=1 Tax=Sphingobacterium sp. SYP-B4668 TaxID=2996035 RepID=UPI0022DE5549|nr:four helix bundle protein [Sphingobacterium sp. SYP-B4668]
MKTHKDLDVWKKSIDLVTTIYELSKVFPKDEVYGLTNQIRRAAVSIPSNISEGAARQSKKEFIQFLYIALGSAMEVETQLIISKNLQYISEKKQIEILDELSCISKMINGLITYLKERN